MNVEIDVATARDGALSAGAELQGMAEPTLPERGGETINCMACRLRVPLAHHREHYRSDWHQVNLKRRMAGLPPISEETFEERVAQLRDAKSAEETRRKRRERRDYFCDVCAKRFSSEKAMEQHLKSRRHIDRVSAVQSSMESEDSLSEHGGATAEPRTGDDMDIGNDNEESDGDGEDLDAPLAFEECVFCGHRSDAIDDNLLHMARHHGFFVPLAESLLDASALMSYLCTKVGSGHACVYCSRRFRSLEAVRTHMLDKSHTRMVDNDEEWYEEYGEFYAWESDDDDDDDGEGGEEWVEVHGEERAEALRDDAAPARADSPPPSVSVGPLADGFAPELILPSGARLGHRSMQRYYQQAPRREERRESVLLNRLMSGYHQLGYASGEVDASSASNALSAGVPPASTASTITVSAAAKAAAARARMLRLSRPAKKAEEHRRRMELNTAKRQYYINKTRASTNIAVMNSGYRP